MTVSPATIERDAFYNQEQVKRLLGISIKAIGNACRAGELRSTERAGRRFVRGAWLIDWLEGKAEASSDHNAESVSA